MHCFNFAFSHNVTYDRWPSRHLLRGHIPAFTKVRRRHNASCRWTPSIYHRTFWRLVSEFKEPKHVYTTWWAISGHRFASNVPDSSFSIRPGWCPYSQQLFRWPQPSLIRPWHSLRYHRHSKEIFRWSCLPLVSISSSQQLQHLFLKVTSGTQANGGHVRCSFSGMTWIPSHLSVSFGYGMALPLSLQKW